jgi:hypothetical protein
MTLSFQTSTAEISKGRAPKAIPDYVQPAIDKALKSPKHTVESPGSPAEIREAASAFRRYRDQHKELEVTISPRDKTGRPTSPDRAVSLLVRVVRKEPDKAAGK